MPTTQSFEFPDEDKASFPALRFLGLQIREGWAINDNTWIMDQDHGHGNARDDGHGAQDFERLLSDAPIKRGFGSPDMLPPE